MIFVCIINRTDVSIKVEQPANAKDARPECCMSTYAEKEDEAEREILAHASLILACRILAFALSMAVCIVPPIRI